MTTSDYKQALEHILQAIEHARKLHHADNRASRFLIDLRLIGAISGIAQAALDGNPIDDRILNELLAELARRPK